MLIVDDEPSFRRAARALLEWRGYVFVGEAGCATSAVELAERVAPDAVLLDVRLGDDSGFDVARYSDPGVASARGAVGLQRRLPIL